MVDRTGPRKGPKQPRFNRSISDYVPPSLERDALPNFDLLDEETKERLRQKARAKIEAEERLRAEDAFLEQEKLRLERELHPELHEPEEEVTIDLAIYTDRLIIDGRHFMHGRTYKVRHSVAAVLRDQMARTHRHYADTHRDPAKAMMEASQAIAKGGPSWAVINGSTGQVTKF